VILAVTWDAGELGRSGREVLGAASRLGAELGADVAVVSLGSDGAGAAEQGGALGATRAFVVEGAETAAGGGAVAAVADLARELGARVVLLAADDQGGDVAPRLAERVGGAAVTHATSFELTDGRLTWVRPVFGGKALARIAPLAEPVVVTIRRGAFEPAEPADAAATVETRQAPGGDGAVELISSEATADESSLEEASVIVSGGGGLGSEEAFSELEELAGLLGGAVGASLAAVDAGWAAPEQQVGLTGKAVSPDLYLAFGISGASQHLAGIAGAKVVVAVNTDPDAPIFAASRLGVVMDSRQLLRALVDELRRGGQ
jgi:electron transfer flavoprotein alpha subunit